jgi:UDP-4-amino-4,6-dideoxy-N-acetyl-beta-L-altrosamine N-acetyltransferase
MVHADLACVLAWRNHPDVRRYMYTQQEITMEQHCQWFERASQDSRRHLLVFESDGQPLGFANFGVAACGRVADWGFYAAPDAPRGTGRRLAQAALDHAFGPLGLHKVCGQVLAYNERSLRFHGAAGFKQEGILRDQHFDGERYHDVVCFGLLHHEWQARP